MGFFNKIFSALKKTKDAFSKKLTALFSRDKIGALIVIERTTKLGEYINSGVVVDAEMSTHILKNIFFNKAPLHDGAVIVRNNRVYAAGCFLPLSTHEDINLELGTRHRAAIGLSELSDAVVIVVSEETGNISVALGGDLKRNYNYTYYGYYRYQGDMMAITVVLLIVIVQIFQELGNRFVVKTDKRLK